jgi:hypothetical protein
MQFARCAVWQYIWMMVGKSMISSANKSMIFDAIFNNFYHEWLPKMIAISCKCKFSSNVIFYHVIERKIFAKQIKLQNV